MYREESETMGKKKIFRSIAIVLLVVLLGSVFSFVSSVENIRAEDSATFSVPISKKIVIDGDLSDWNNIKKHYITKATFGYDLDYIWNTSFAWDGEKTFYLTATVTYPKGMDGPYASRPVNSPTWYEDDVIEFIIAGKRPTSEREFQELSRASHYVWNSKLNFAAEEAGGLLVTKVAQTSWGASQDGVWCFEAAIELSDDIISRIKNNEFVYMNVMNRCRSGGVELSTLNNINGFGSSFWNVEYINEFIFDKTYIVDEVKPVPVTPTVKVKSVKVNKKKISLKVKKSKKLKVVFNPKAPTNKKVNWKSSNKKIAKVNSNGKVTALKPGKTKITVTSVDGKKKANCIVAVKK